MRCPTCGEANPEHRRFCGECGAPLVETCPVCSASREPGTKFCGQCGSRFAAPGADLPPSAGPGRVAAAERRVCSMLFCDLVGFTPLSEARDPEEVRELLTRYFDAARTVIGRYGGTVEKFAGDAVMAVWGAPTATEGDAERSVRAALDIVDAVAHLGEQVGLATLAARAGVVTGEVAVRLDAVGEGMVVGDPVNTAARVQAAAEPGTVLVDDGTWRAARGAVTFTSAGGRAFKGKAEPVRLWRADRVVSGVGGAQRMDGLEAPLVGREAELRLVKELFHASAERGSARLLSVIGPAGVGKSRLGWELEKYIDGLATVVYWHRGRCLSYGDGVAFWALAEMVRQRLNIAEEDTASVAAQKLTAGLDAWLSDAADGGYVRPSLARLLGVDAAGAAGPSREELFAGWRLFFERLAAVAPVVLLVEDAQHADAGLLDFLDHLLDWSRDAPIFVMTLARPELLDRRPGWGVNRRNGTSLSLEPLDETATGVLLDRLVPGMPDGPKRAIAAQAEGIPLYAVETVRTLIDRDVVQPLDGVYRLIGEIGELAVPDSLQSLLAARLDALPADARRLVGDAAVLGSRFPAESLVAVSERSAEEVHRLLADLVRREVFAVSADPLSPERGQYGFVQTMVRQVAYDTLSRRERKARHLTVAAHLQRAFADGGDEVSEVVAQHLLDALAAVPDDPDVADLRRQAVAALIRAAERSMRTGAPATAVRAYSDAASLYDRAADEDALAAARLDERAGDAATVAFDLVTAADRFRSAVETYQRLGRTRDAARARVGQGRALRRQGRFDEAAPLLRAALAALTDADEAEAVTALSELATLESAAGREAEGLFQEALDRAQALGLPAATIADLFIGLGIDYTMRNRPAQGTALLTAAAGLADGDEALAAKALVNLADVMLVTNNAAGAADAAGRAVAYSRRVGARQFLSMGSSNLVLALLLTGDWEEAEHTYAAAMDDGLTEDPYIAAYGLALRWLRTGTVPAGAVDAVERLADSQDPQDRLTVALARAFEATSRGDTAATLHHARVAIDGAIYVGEETVRWAWPLAADAALALGDPVEAERLVEWLDAHPRGHIPPVLRAERARIAAAVLAARGDPEAGSAYAGAVDALRNLGSPYHLAVGLLDFAAYAAAAGDPEQARSAASEAAAIAERLGAQPLQRRADLMNSQDPRAAQHSDRVRRGRRVPSLVDRQAQ